MTIDIAKRALAQYPLIDPTIEPLAYTHHPVFEVTSGEAVYTLRLNQNVSNRLHLHFEMVLLDALHAHQFPYSVPKPVVNRQGEFLTEVDTTIATLVTYINGDIRTVDELTPDEAYQIGLMIGRFHVFNYDLPTTFSRPHLDYNGLFTDEGLYPIQPYLVQLSEEQQRILQTVALRVRSMMTMLGTNSYQYGLIHGDLLLPNIVFAGEQLGMLDFEYCGWGYYLYDLTPILWQLKTHPHYAEYERRVWEGYTFARPKLRWYRNMLETLIAGRQVASIRWLLLNADNPNIYPHAPRIIAHRIEELRHFVHYGTLNRTMLAL